MTPNEQKIQEAAAQSGGGVSDTVLKYIIDTANCLNGWVDHIELGPDDDHNAHVVKLLLASEMALRLIGFDGDEFADACNKFQDSIMQCSPDKNAKQMVINLEEAA
jgi:hypothetical protein